MRENARVTSNHFFMKFPLIQLLVITPLVGILCQCSTIADDCAAIAARDRIIQTEEKGDYYVGRRYYVPNTRFWGYIRRPSQPWSSAKLVMMDESAVLNPDRGAEPPHPKAVFGKDNNYEYVIKGRYVGEPCYDPNSNMVLPVFKASSFTLRDTDPGFLFTPSENYDPSLVNLFPELTPTAADFRRARVAPVNFGN